MKSGNELRLHPTADKVVYVVQGLGDGFHLGFNKKITVLEVSGGNMALALLNPHVIDNYLQLEIRTGRVAGPFT